MTKLSILVFYKVFRINDVQGSYVCGCCVFSGQTFNSPNPTCHSVSTVFNIRPMTLLQLTTVWCFCASFWDVSSSIQPKLCSHQGFALLKRKVRLLASLITQVGYFNFRSHEPNQCNFLSFLGYANHIECFGSLSGCLTLENRTRPNIIQQLG